MGVTRELHLPALEVCQGEWRLYSFAVDGKQVPRFATISRVERADGGRLVGYQRAEVRAHIEEIKNLLETEAPMVPNAVVLAFDRRVKFQPAVEGFDPVGGSRAGLLVIPVTEGQTDEDKPGFVVDGQQRLAAVREAQVRQFPLCVTAFITDDIQEQTEQFILVNSTRPLQEVPGLRDEVLQRRSVKPRGPSFYRCFLNARSSSRDLGSITL